VTSGELVSFPTGDSAPWSWLVGWLVGWLVSYLVS